MNVHKQQGFTLIELAMVLLIIGILSAGGIQLLSNTVEQRKYQQTQTEMQEIKEALITYYAQFGRLPCPDHEHMPSDSLYGLEKPNIPNGSCSNTKGWLPHVTLGMGAAGDAWGQRYRYIIHPIFTTLASTPLAACSIDSNNNSRALSYSNNNIKTQTLTSPPISTSEWSGFILISTGKNGAFTNASMRTVNGAFDGAGGCPQLHILEQENCDNDTLLSAGLALADSNSIVFDDLVIWASDMQLIAAARKAGRCHL